MPGFSLLTQPWLPCLTRAGRPTEVSLCDLIVHCHEYSELFDQSPLVTMSLHRLLLALVRRIYPHGTAAEWHAIYDAGRFDAAVAERYFARWADRFDLFDPQHPFMQSRLGESAKLHPCTWLMQEAASGNNPTLFDHSVDAKPKSLPPAAAARALITVQAVALGGGVSEPFNFCDAPLARDCVALVYGGTLFETLMLNSPPAPSGAGDMPMWERAVLPAPERGGTPIPGEMSLFTWPARRVRLIADPDTGHAVACQVQQGLVAPADYHDPHKAGYSDQDGSLVPLRLSPPRAIWRDLPVWLGLREQTCAPEAIVWLRKLVGQSRHFAPVAPLQLAVFGLATVPGRASVQLWRHERYPLTEKCLRDSDCLHEYPIALDRAEVCGDVLAAAISFLGKLVSLPADAAESAAKEAGLNYWSRLDRAVREFTFALADRRSDAVADWNALLVAAAEESFATAASRLARLGGRARGIAAAGRFLTQRLLASIPTADSPERGGLADVR